MAHSVSITMPTVPLPARSFIRIPVTISAGSGIGFTDLTFVLPDGTAAGRASLAPGAAGNAFVLLVGYSRGTHTINAIDRRNNTLVGQAKFDISDGAASFDGPSYWSTR